MKNFLYSLGSFIVGVLVVGTAFAATPAFTVPQGGTGWGAIQTGAIPYGQGTSRVATTTQGTSGQVLSWSNGIPKWVSTTTPTTISGTLGVANGGTGQTSFLQGWLGINNSGAFIASTSPTVAWLTSTSTTATSTFAYGLNVNSGCIAFAGTCLQTFIQNATAYKSAVFYATAAILPGTPTYNNGASGVGATLTEIGFGALTVDGQAVSAGQRILVKNEATQANNGIYVVTTVGSAIANYVLTRATDFDETTDVYAGTTIPVLVGGTTNGDTVWTESTTGTIVIGTTAIAFIETSVGTAADTFAWPFTPTSYGNSTSSVTAFLGGLISTGSTTIAGLGSGLTGTNNGLLYSFASSSLFGYTPLNPTRAINTTFPLQGGGALSSDLTLTNAFSTTSNSGMSQGNLYVGSGGIFQTSASSSIFGYTPLNPTRALTIAGTGNQITSSAGSQDLSADRTWTLSIPQAFQFPLSYTSTYGTTTYASSTILTTTGSTYLSTSAGSVGIGNTAPGSKLDVTGYINTDQFSGYRQAGNTILVASSTIFSTLVGQGAGVGLMPDGVVNSSIKNTVVGYQALQYATTSAWSTAIGYQALRGTVNVNTGSENTAVGFFALTANTTGNSNVAVGGEALSANTTGGNNVALGTGALTLNTTGSANIAIGTSVLGANTTGGSNIAIGTSALALNTTASNGVAIGVSALSKNTTGVFNAAVGNWAMKNNTTGGYNSVFGGEQTLSNNSTGSFNVAVGAYASAPNLSATSTTAVGYSAGGGNGSNFSGAQGYTFVGYQAGQVIQAGADYNTGIGYNAGYALTTGTKNINLGAFTTGGNANITTGSNNIIIGNDTQAPSATASNQLNIGNLIYGTGLDGTGSTVSSGKIGIASTSPWAKLSIGSGGGIVVGQNLLATSTSMTVDWRQGNSQNIRMLAAGVTVAFTGYIPGSQLRLTVCNGATASGALTFSNTDLLWTGGTVPSKTTTANKCDIYSFVADYATSTMQIFGAQTANF